MHAAVKKPARHSVTFVELKKDFICMQNSTLGKKKIESTECFPVHCLCTQRLQKAHKQNSNQFLLFICYVYEKRMHIHWERLATILHMGSNDK